MLTDPYGMRYNYKTEQKEREEAQNGIPSYERTPMNPMVPAYDQAMNVWEKGDNNLTVWPFPKLPQLQLIWTMTKMHHAETTAMNEECKKSCCTMPRITRQRRPVAYALGYRVWYKCRSSAGPQDDTETIMHPVLDCMRYCLWHQEFMTLLPQHDMMDMYSPYASV